MRIKKIIRRDVIILLSLLFCLSFVGCAGSGDAKPVGKIPVIFDTNIGCDIDDTWALGFLLRSPELDVKLIVSDNGLPEYRSKIIARVLECEGDRKSVV